MRTGTPANAIASTTAATTAMSLQAGRQGMLMLQACAAQVPRFAIGLANLVRRPRDRLVPATATLLLSASSFAGAVWSLDMPMVPEMPNWREPEAAYVPQLDDALTLDQAIEIALRHSRTVQNSTIAVADAVAGRQATLRTLFNPQLEGAYEYGIWSDQEDRTNVGNGEVKATGRVAGWSIEPFVGFDFRPTTNDYATGAGIAFSRQLLKWNEGLRQRILVSRANRNLVRAINDRLVTLRNVRLSVTEAYLALQRQMATLNIRRSRAVDAEDFLEEVQAKVENNLAAPVEQTNAELDVNRAKTDVLDAENAVERDLDRLLGLMGVGNLTTRPTVAIDNVVELPGELPFMTDLQIVTSRHERLSNLEWDLALLTEEVLLAHDNIMPDVEGRVSLGYDYVGDQPWSNDDGGAAEALLGIEFRLPLDNWRSERAIYRQRQLDYDEKAIEIDQVRLELETNLRQQSRDYSLQSARVLLVEARVDAEQDKLDATLRQYEVGAIDNLEVSRAKRALDDAKISLLGARVDRLRSYARYLALIPAENAPPLPAAGDYVELPAR